jgi:hypothetical protein
MDKKSFWILLDIIAPDLLSTGMKGKRGSVPNGPITKSERLSMVLRYFAGGDPLDIAHNHKMGSGEVLKSVWDIVDAIHSSKELLIKFPDNHEDQLRVAAGFLAKSAVNFDNCVGAVDGILIWIHKPSKSGMKRQGFGEMKCFCGRKKKYGLNMQGTCDSRGIFLDVEIAFPGVSSDYFAFQYSKLKAKLEKKVSSILDCVYLVTMGILILLTWLRLSGTSVMVLKTLSTFSDRSFESILKALLGYWFIVGVY